MPTGTDDQGEGSAAERRRRAGPGGAASRGLHLLFALLGFCRRAARLLRARAPAAMFTRAVNRLSRKRPPSGKGLWALGRGKGWVVGVPWRGSRCRPDSSCAPPGSLCPSRGGSAEPGSRPGRKLSLKLEPQQLFFSREGLRATGETEQPPTLRQRGSQAPLLCAASATGRVGRMLHRTSASPERPAPRRQKVESQGGCTPGRGSHFVFSPGPVRPTVWGNLARQRTHSAEMVIRILSSFFFFCS